MRREKLIVVLTILVDVIGIGIVIPILPFYVSSFGASPFTVTALFSAFALFAFISAPFLGALSDRVGRRVVLLASLASTALGWFVFASAQTILVLFVGRIIDGAAAGNLTVAQSCLVDISRTERERAENLGLIGAFFGLGFLIGPMLGATLSTVSHSFPFYVAGALALANSILAFFFLPETHSKRDPAAALTFNPIRPLARAATSAELRPWYFRWFLFGLGFALSQSVFALFAESAFGFDSFTTGLLFTLMGAFMAFNQTVLLKHFWLRYFSEARLEWLMFLFFLLGFVLIGAHNVWLFYVGIPLSSVSQALLRVVMTSQVAGRAPAHMKGEVIGILTSILALSMVVGPVLAGALFEVRDFLPYGLGAILAGVALWSFRRQHRGTFTHPPAETVHPGA